MNFRLLTTLFLFLPGLFCLAQEEDKGTCARAKSLFRAKSGTLSPSRIRQTEKYDVHYYKVELDMNHLSTTLSGTVEMRAHTRVATDSVVFELFPSLTISEIRLNGTVVPFRRIATAVVVPAGLPAGAAFRISTQYAGTPPTSANTAIGGSGMSNRASPTWGNSVTWSLSQPFSAYEWWPCKQSLRDKIDSLDVWLTVPSSCKGGSNGVLVATTNLGNGKTRYEWKHRHPISYYLVSVAVAEYVEYTRWAHPENSDSIKIQNFIYNNPATLTQFRDDIDETVDFMELFARLYGPYPFADEKYGHCMAPFSGGMEHQTMTTQGTFNASLTAHELGHQWFGDHVTCASWADLWVNEGFATYSEYLMWENLYPGQEVQDMLDIHNQVMGQPGGSVWVEDSLNETRLFSSRLTYSKGAAILHTFRYLADNDSLFFRTLKTFNERFADSTALGTDFQALLEEITGKSYGPAFEEWYFGQGFPTYTARWNNVAGDLHLRISQTASMPAITPFFTTPLEITFRRTGLPDTVIRFPIGGPSQTFIVPGMGNVSSILNLDPKNWILNRNGLTSRDPSLVVTGVEKPEAEADWLVYPNPAGERVFVRHPENLPFRVRLLDTRGRCISEGENPEGGLDLRGLPPGLYHLILQENGPGNRTRHRILRH